MMLIAPIRISASTSNDTTLWIARSCVGEAGFESAETGECAAIAHIYKKRAALSGMSVLNVARKYSAAIKPHGKLWVRSLRADGMRPAGFPERLVWHRYQSKWKAVLKLVEGVLGGTVKDPLPTALHYGGWLDRGRLSPKVWRRIKTKYRNYFYERIDK